MRNFFFPLIALAMLSFSCKRKSPCTNDPPLETHLSAEDLSYFDFPVGAWWLFENDSTGARDSVYVVSNTDSRIANPDEVEGCIFSYSYVKTVQAYSPYYDHINTSILNAGGICNSGSFRFGGWGNITFISPSCQPTGVDTSFHELAEYDSISFMSNVFYDVTLFRNSGYGQGPPINRLYTGYFYYAKNIGLIKWELDGSDSVWTLINYGGF